VTHPAAAEPVETVWSGKYLIAKKRGTWEYVSRAGGIRAAVILAIDAGAVILVEQYRVSLGRACLELPAGLVGDVEAVRAPKSRHGASLRRKPAIAPNGSRIWASSIRRRAWRRKASPWSAPAA
jgi:ADP-ribose pyrophosphatase